MGGKRRDANTWLAQTTNCVDEQLVKGGRRGDGGRMGREEREGIILLLYPHPLSPRPPTDNTHTNILNITICLKKKQIMQHIEKPILCTAHYGCACIPLARK